MFACYVYLRFFPFVAQAMRFLGRRENMSFGSLFGGFYVGDPAASRGQAAVPTLWQPARTRSCRACLADVFLMPAVDVHYQGFPACRVRCDQNYFCSPHLSVGFLFSLSHTAASSSRILSHTHRDRHREIHTEIHTEKDNPTEIQQILHLHVLHSALS